MNTALDIECQGVASNFVPEMNKQGNWIPPSLQPPYPFVSEHFTKRNYLIIILFLIKRKIYRLCPDSSEKPA